MICERGREFKGPKRWSDGGWGESVMRPATARKAVAFCIDVALYFCRER